MRRTRPRKAALDWCRVRPRRPILLGRIAGWRAGRPRSGPDLLALLRPPPRFCTAMEIVIMFRWRKYRAVNIRDFRVIPCPPRDVRQPIGYRNYGHRYLEDHSVLRGSGHGRLDALMLRHRAEQKAAVGDEL